MTRTTLATLMLFPSFAFAAESRIEGPFTAQSRIYPGTTRQYWIYVPAQYDADEPACVMMVQDGLRCAENWNLPAVLDELIGAGAVPPTIGVFIAPGVYENGGANRSNEYDSVDDRYARFLIEEMLPKIGQSYSLTDDPNGRSIAGSSSGGICAFNVAWQRPDAFRRVFSGIGSFTDLRGGHDLAAQVRKFEPKPLRVYLQDGSNDLNNYAGSWFLANQTMLGSLEWAGYDVHHEWGEGGHNPQHARAVMPQALRWLWQDYPKPIEPGGRASDNNTVAIPGEGWQTSSISVPASHSQEAPDVDEVRPPIVLRNPMGKSNCPVTALLADANTWHFCATPLGIQCSDEQGRVHQILNAPTEAPITALFWGDDEQQLLCAASGNKVYQRKIVVTMRR